VSPRAPGTRPTSLLVIGWLFVAGSVISILSGLQGLVTYRTTRAEFDQMLSQGGGLPADMPYLQYGLVFMDLLIPLMLLSIAVSGFVLFVAIRFLQCRAWARRTLESLCWMGVVSGVGIVVVLAAIIWALLSGHPMAMVGGGVVLLIGALIVVPQAILLVLLRGKAIRSAAIH
jgi:hypothetical protein